MKRTAQISRSLLRIKYIKFLTSAVNTILVTELFLGSIACDSLESRNIDEIPVDLRIGECFRQVSRALGQDQKPRLCMHFTDPEWPCVLSFDQEPQCPLGEDCSFSPTEWTQHCPQEGVSGPMVRGGELLSGVLSVVPSDVACPSSPFKDGCAGSVGGVSSAEDSESCLAQAALTYQIDKRDGSLQLSDTPVVLEYSRFLLEDLEFESESQLCPSIVKKCPDNLCSDEATLTVEFAGIAPGHIDVDPLFTESTFGAFECSFSNTSCSEEYPRDRAMKVTVTTFDPNFVDTSTGPGPVVTRLTAPPNIGDACNENFFAEPTTSATCIVSVPRDVVLTAFFGRYIDLQSHGHGTVTSETIGADGDGIDCSSVDAPGRTCFEFYEQEVTVDLVAHTENEQWPFLGWSSNCETNLLEAPNRCRVTMNRSHRIDAKFGYAVSVNILGDGQVDVDDVESCTADELPCLYPYEEGAMVELKAIANPNSVWSRWTGDCEGQPDICSLVVDPHPVTQAIFAYKVRWSSSDGGTVAVVSTSDAPCIDSETNCGAYEPEKTVILRAEPAPGWGILQWEGCTRTEGETCEVDVTTSSLAHATFGRKVTVEVYGNGTLQSSNGDICRPGTACELVVTDGSTLTWAALDGADAFQTWGGDCLDVQGNTCSILVDRATRVIGIFGKSLVVNVVGEANITFVPDGAPCGRNCRAYTSTETVTLIPSFGPGWVFREWVSGEEEACVSTSGADCVLMVTGDAQFVTLVLDVEFQVALTQGTGLITGGTDIDCAGFGGSGCRATRAFNSTVLLEVSADDGWEVYEWINCTPPQNSDRSLCEFEVTHPMTVSIELGRLLFTNTTGGGSIGVLSNRPGQACGTECDGTVYPDGTDLTLRALPSGGQSFASWGENCANANSTVCYLTMDESRRAHANFGWQTTINITGGGQVSGTGINCPGDCNAIYNTGSTIRLVATPDPYWRFGEWIDCPGTIINENICTFTVDGQSVNVEARFHPRLLVTGVSHLPISIERISSSPSGVDCNLFSTNPCTEADYYPEIGALVELTASAPPGRRVTWTWPVGNNLCPSAGNGNFECVFVMPPNPTEIRAEYLADNVNLELTVTNGFALQPAAIELYDDDDNLLSVSPNPCIDNIAGNKTCNYSLGRRSTIFLQTAGSRPFSHWSGDCTGNSTRCRLDLIQNNSSVTAHH